MILIKRSITIQLNSNSKSELKKEINKYISLGYDLKDDEGITTNNTELKNSLLEDYKFSVYLIKNEIY